MEQILLNIAREGPPKLLIFNKNELTERMLRLIFYQFGREEDEAEYYLQYALFKYFYDLQEYIFYNPSKISVVIKLRELSKICPFKFERIHTNTFVIRWKLPLETDALKIQKVVSYHTILDGRLLDEEHSEREKVYNVLYPI